MLDGCVSSGQGMQKHEQNKSMVKVLETEGTEQLVLFQGIPEGTLMTEDGHQS